MDNNGLRNAYASGREAAHADNDWNDRECAAIHAAMLEEVNNDTSDPRWLAFTTGFLAGKREG